MDSGNSFDPSVTACFTGHRSIGQSDVSFVCRQIRDAIQQACDKGYSVFLCGGALGFDTLAALEVIRFRQEHPGVRLVIVMPCATQADRWPEKDRGIYQSILKQADRTVCLSDAYYAGCMQVRNRYMVDASSLCLCYMTRFEGGTWSTVRYALHRGVQLKNIAIPDPPDTVMKEKPWNFISISHFVSGNVSIVLLLHFPRQRARRMHISKRFSGKRKFGARSLQSRF